VTSGWTRRQALRHIAVFGAAGAPGLFAHRADAELPPETANVRFLETPIICGAPLYVAQELLKAEGFRDISFVPYPRWNDALAVNAVDISFMFAPSLVMRVDAGAPIVALGGIHPGCVELIGRTTLSSTRALRGKRVAVSELGSDEHVFTSMFGAHVGLNPHRDIEWIVRPIPYAPLLFANGGVDAFMTGPPFSFQFREQKIGKVLVNTTTDKPWSQYLCCVVAARQDFVQRHPVAVKRILRALLKSTDLCAREPERMARLVTARAPNVRYEDVLQTLRELAYGRWRQYDPEDALRFFALRLHETGLIRSSPQKIIAQGTDWRFVRELRRELKS